MNIRLCDHDQHWLTSLHLLGLLTPTCPNSKVSDIGESALTQGALVQVLGDSHSGGALLFRLMSEFAVTVGAADCCM